MAEEEKRGEKWLKTDETDMAWKNKGIYIRFALIYSKALLVSYLYEFTPARTLSISGLKSRVLKLSFLSLQMMVKSGLEFILKFTEPSEIPAKLPGQFGHFGQMFLHWAAATLKGHGEFQNKKSRPRFTVVFK